MSSSPRLDPLCIRSPVVPYQDSPRQRLLLCCDVREAIILHSLSVIDQAKSPPRGMRLWSSNGEYPFGGADSPLNLRCGEAYDDPDSTLLITTLSHGSFILFRNILQTSGTCIRMSFNKPSLVPILQGSSQVILYVPIHIVLK
jgi:hypothetical protein